MEAARVPNIFGSLRCLCCGVSSDCTLVRNVLCHGSCSLYHHMAKSENHHQEKLAAAHKKVADLENSFHASKEVQAVKMPSFKMVMIVCTSCIHVHYLCVHVVCICVSFRSIYVYIFCKSLMFTHCHRCILICVL